MKLLTFILTLCSLPLLSQHSSQLGRFAVEYEQGCAPVTVEIIVQDTFGNITRQYEYERGLQETTNTTYRYDTPGVYEIIQYLGEDISPKSDTLTFTVTESPAPRFDILQCSEEQVSVEITDNTYDYYSVKFSDTDSVIYHPGDTNPQYEYTTNSGSVSVKGYYGNSFPTCAEQNMAFNLQAFSETQLTSFTLSQGCVDSLFVQLQAEGFNPSYQYLIEYSTDEATFTSIYRGKITAATAYYPLNATISSDSLCIRLSTLNACDGSVISSQTTCHPINPSTALADAYATYSGSAIALKIGQVYGSVLVERKTGNSSYSDLTEVNGDYLDESASRFRQTFYRLTQTDTCGYTSDPIEVAPPFLALRDKSLTENTIQIELNTPVNGLGSYEENLLFYSTDSTKTQVVPFSQDVRLPAGLGEAINIRGSYLYTGDSIRIYSNPITTEYEARVFVPSAFTPNGDGMNDELELFGLPTEEFEILIFDRWGKVIHQSNINPVWDGKKGKDRIDEGSYTYKLRFRLETGELKTQVGTFTLIRK